jgi:L-aminopeptidase/D-esterase-like protein
LKTRRHVNRKTVAAANKNFEALSLSTGKVWIGCVQIFKIEQLPPPERGALLRVKGGLGRAGRRLKNLPA